MLGDSLRAEFDFEFAVFILDQLDHPGRTRPVEQRADDAGDRIKPAAESLFDGEQQFHRAPAFKRVSLCGSSSSSIQDKTRNGSALSSDRRMTNSEFIRRPLSKTTRTVTREALLPSKVAYFPETPSNGMRTCLFAPEISR